MIIKRDDNFGNQIPFLDYDVLDKTIYEAAVKIRSTVVDITDPFPDLL